MKLFRYIILVLILCNIPSFVLFSFGDSLGGLFSYLVFALLLLYYFLNKKHNLAWPFVIFAITFFIISGPNYVLIDEKYYYYEFIKYLIIIICGGELARNTTLKEIYAMFLIGASSILMHAAFFSDDYGRYSGFFLNPNSAGFVCLIGCALSFGLVNEKWKLIGLFFFTFSGALTFSRTFFLLWIIIILISVFQNKKNINALILGFGAVLLLLSVATIFQLNTQRLSIVESLFDDNFKSTLANEDSRTETWSVYYDKIADAPFFGNGYKSFAGFKRIKVGVHNTYLRIIGESGIIPLLIFITIYIFMLIRSLKTFKTKVFQTLLVFSIIALFLTTHNFEDNYYITFISIWLYFGLIAHEKKEEEILTFTNI
ncbi:O-antigen ligase family protein [bacterium AH-315-P13]|nr:O-antigen ligase family protein [bacterium AH-315-P13]